jgi:small-conductance mechanosensitive channel
MCCQTGERKAKLLDGQKMFGDEDEESVFDRLWAMILDRFGFIAPLWIIRRPESLTIQDYRPTFTMFLTLVGFAILAVSFVLLFFKVDRAASLGLWAIGAPLAVCVIFLFRGTVREVYYFERATDSYAFVRQFIHRREVIEGAMSQFTGAYVKTESNDDSKSYFVILKQEGMFLAGIGEQTLREEVPIFNSFEREAEIADAISEFLASKG